MLNCRIWDRSVCTRLRAGLGFGLPGCICARAFVPRFEKSCECYEIKLILTFLILFRLLIKRPIYELGLFK